MNDQAIKNCKSILKRNHLHPIKKLGKGAFATVFLVEKISLQKNENQLYSAKCINKKQILKRPSLNKYIKQEIQILRNIEHPNVVRSFRTFQGKNLNYDSDQGWIFMVMEYCDKGNLNTKLAESQGGCLSLDQTFYVAWDVFKGIQYMHGKGILHRDIKAENVLLSSKKQFKSKKSLDPASLTKPIDLNGHEYTTKICDFGFAREQDQTVNTFCGTTCYMAPEIFQQLNYGNKVDIWALGVLIFFMLFGDFPFKGNFKFTSGMNVEFQIKKKCSDGFKLSNSVSTKVNETITKQDFKILEEMFKKIFVIDPEERISLTELKKYPWFKKHRYYSEEEQLSTSSTDLSEKFILKPKKQQHLNSEKTTIQSDQSSSDNQLASPRNSKNREKNIGMEKYLFLKEIIEEVQKQKFLKSIEEVAFKYYMFKMLFCEFAKSFEKSNCPEHKKQLEILSDHLEKNAILLQNNLSKLQIQKFHPQNFNLKAKQFSEFKESYRLVIGHVFAKAHKNITEDIHIRSQLKLKLFVCHVINRVFNSDHNEGIFIHFERYLTKMGLKSKNVLIGEKQFSFKSFRKWISTEDPEKLVQTVELMNEKYYKGK